MKTLSIFLCAFMYFISTHAQTKTYTKETISQLLYKQTFNIGEKLLLAAKQGKIKAHWNDSLRAAHTLELLNKTGKNIIFSKESICGLLTFYTWKDDATGRTKFLEMGGVAVLYKPVINGTELPQMPMFFVSYDDFSKTVTENERKLVQTLSNLMFGTFENTAYVINNDSAMIYELMEMQYFNNLEQRSYRVILSEEHFKIFALSFKRYLGQSVGNYIFNGSTVLNDSFKISTLKAVYADADMKMRFTDKELKKVIFANDRYDKHIFTKPGSENETETIQFPVDFELAENILINQNSVGLQINQTDGPKTFYVQRKEFMATLPAWLKFIIENYL